MWRAAQRRGRIDPSSQDGTAWGVRLTMFVVEVFIETLTTQADGRFGCGTGAPSCGVIGRGIEHL